MRWLLVLVGVVLLAGCVGLAPENQQTLEGGIGEVDGLTPESEIAVDAEDGLNETERELLVKRSMARVEVVRNLRFKRPVEVEVVTREEYQSDRGGSDVNETTRRWNNQVWEGLFLVGENRNIYEVFNETFGASVLGFYQPGEDRIVIVSDEETPTISKGTLVHELVHALQDQQFGIDDRPSTQDRQLAWQGVVEGEANHVQQLYLDRCGTEWRCIRPPTEPAASADGIDRNVIALIIHPYRSGPNFVQQIRTRGDWQAVDNLHGSYPQSTEQIIYPDRYPDQDPVNVTVPDRSGDEWSRFDHDPVGDTLGPASIHVMLERNGVIQAGGDYRDETSDGWAGDQLVPYRGGDEDAYVWYTEWRTADDARQFHEAYRDLLERQDATARSDGVFVIEEGPYADAYRVTRDGSTVRIVNAPTAGALDGVHAG